MVQSSKLRNLPQPWAVLFPLGIRTFIWFLFFGVLFILRSFFLLIFLTFIFTYIQNTGVNRLKVYIKNRVISVILVTIVFIGAIFSVLSFIGPEVRTQALSFVDNYPVYARSIDNEIKDIVKSTPILLELLPEEVRPVEDSSYWNASTSPTIYFLKKTMGIQKKDNGSVEDLAKVFSAIKDLWGSIASIVSSFLLALLFSFLILLDLGTLKRTLTELHNTRISFIYDEVSGSVYQFCKVLGRAFEAQLIIAIVNTVLTAVGLHILGIENQIAFLLMIVFLCSFIPVAGVFISSVPICLVALQEVGIHLVIAAIVLITIIHLIEAYILNPKIYGSRMHLNPVIVLMILTIGGKLFHVWGFLLGVPVFTYIFDQAIRPSQKTKVIIEEGS